LKESGARPGQWVALPGAGGGLGHLSVQYANAMGLRVLAVDTGKEKEELCKKLGAEAFVDFKTSKDVITEVKEITDGGPHAVIVMAASAKPYEDALKMVRTKGTVVAVGLPAKAIMGADVFDTVTRSLTIKGSYVYAPLKNEFDLIRGNRADTAEALDFLARGKVKVFYKTRGLSELPQVYEEMEKGTIAGRIVLDTSK